VVSLSCFTNIRGFVNMLTSNRGMLQISSNIELKVVDKTKMGRAKTKAGRVRKKIERDKTKMGRVRVIMGCIKTKMGKSRQKIGQAKTKMGWVKTKNGMSQDENGKNEDKKIGPPNTSQVTLSTPYAFKYSYPYFSNHCHLFLLFHSISYHHI